MAKNYYEILGVKPSDTPDFIKKAYRKLSMQYHPDRNQGDKAAEDKFKEINEAYNAIKDGKASNTSSSSNTNYRGAYDFDGGFDFSDFFTNRQQKKGNTYNRHNDIPTDIKINIDITIDESILGGTKNIRYNVLEFCRICDGHGGHRTTCNTCGGTGKSTSKTLYGVFLSICNSCGGTGQHTPKNCKSCSGDGYSRKSTVLKTTIPPKTPHGSFSNYKGAGNKNNSGDSGDATIIFNIIKSDIFTISKDTDLITALNIPFESFIVGYETYIKLGNETISVNVTPFTNPQGAKLVIPNKGLYTSRETRGNIFINVICIMPDESPNNIGIYSNIQDKIEY